MKYFAFILSLILFSCLEKKDLNINSKIIHKIYYQDTTQVDFYADVEDTIYRFKVNTFNKDIDLEDGDWIIYYDKEFSQKLRILPIENLMQKGKEIYWYRNGQKKWENEDSLGLRIGKSLSWYESGEIQTESLFSNDTIIYYKKFYKDGGLWVNQEFINNSLNKEVIHFKNGLRRELYYVEGNPVNKAIIQLEFDSNGIFLNADKLFELELETIENTEWAIYRIPVSIDSFKYSFKNEFKKELLESE